MKIPLSFLIIALVVFIGYNQLVSCGQLRGLSLETNISNVDHCVVSEGAVCYKCEPKYYLFNNTCLHQVTSCLEYVDNYGCAKCVDGAFLLKTIHEGRNCMYCSEMCEKCADYTGCVKCLPDFRRIVANFDGAYYNTCHF